VERSSGDGKIQRVGFKPMAIGGLAFGLFEHGTTEVASENMSGLRVRIQSQRQIAGAAADIQHLRAGPFENVREAGYGARAPITIDVQR